MKEAVEEKVGYKKTKLGWIPEDWEVKTVGDIAEVKGGKRLPKGYQLTTIENPYPYITVSDMFEGGVDTSKIRYIPEEIADTISRYKISIKDIFISVAGTLGIVGEIPQSLDNANLTENADKITNIKCNKKYLLNLFKSAIIQNKIELEKTSAAQPKLALTRIRKFKIPLPPLPEQQKIAHILTTWDKAIKKTSTLIEEKEQLKKGLMQKLLTGKMRFQEFDKGEEVQFTKSQLDYFIDKWKLIYIGELYKSLSTGMTPSRKKPEYFNGDILWLTSGELNYGTITDTNEKITSIAVKNTNLKIYPPGTFFIAITGLEAAGTRGKCAFIDREATTNQSCMAFPKNDKINLNFLCQLYLLYGEKIGLKFAQGTKQQSLNSKIIKSLKIPLPTLPEQQKIANCLSALDQEIQLLQQQQEQLEWQKKGLMQQLLTGKIRVVLSPQN